jgi:hypothetical protein
MSGIDKTTGASGVNGAGYDGAEGPSADGDDPLLPPPANALALAGDPGELVALLVMKSSAAARKAHESEEAAAQATQDAEETAQVTEMRNKAAETKSNALTAGILDISSGALTIASASVSARSMQLDYDAKVVDPKAFLAGNTSDRIAATWEKGVVDTLSKGVSTGGELIRKSGDVARTESDARTTEHEHLAAHAKREADEVRERIGDDKKLFDEAIAFVREYSQARDQACLAAARRA